MMNCCVFVIAASLALTSCDMLDKTHPPDTGLVLRVGGTPFPEDGYVFSGTGPYTITVTVENTRSTATGELTLTIDGAADGQHFTVSPTTLNSIAANASDTFTITVTTPIVSGRNNAEIRIDDQGFRKTAQVWYRENPISNRESFYGNWANTARNNGAEIQWNSFRYYNTSSTAININVTSRILDWTEETFVIQDFGISQIPSGPANATQTAYKLTCQVTYIASYTGPNLDMSALFGLVTESPTVGHKFNVWVFQRGSGIHLGIRRDLRDNPNKVPWVVFMPE
jgi:hypothetical protein